MNIKTIGGVVVGNGLVYMGAESSVKVAFSVDGKKVVLAGKDTDGDPMIASILIDTPYGQKIMTGLGY